MKMESVRVLVNENGRYGVIVNAATESFIRTLSEVFFWDLKVRKGWLIKSLPVFGYDCILINNKIHPIQTVNNGLTKIQFVDFTKTVSFSEGDDYAM